MKRRRWWCALRGHGELRVESMLRNGRWLAAPSFPLEWAGTLPSVRAVCERCGTVVRG